MTSLLLLLFSALLFYSCQPTVKSNPDIKESSSTTVLLGIDNLLSDYLHLIKGKRIGLLTNPSGVNGQLLPTSDLLYEHEQIDLKALFGPEHGIRGAVYGGEKIANAIDEKTGIPVFSLYGSSRKPTSEMLEDLDIIIIDIQDIGLRAYTYVYTMALVMEAAAEFDKRVIVLDRPNPIGGTRVEGNLVDETHLSFVGLYPIPYQHGMTIAELALLFNNEFNINCKLQVIPMQNWKREMLWEHTGLHWIPTSPHVPHWRSILFMGATGTFGELHILSEGVGYTSPFEIVGAPWINGMEFSNSLNQLNLPGVYFRPLFFKPYYARYAAQVCQGVQLHITDPYAFEPYKTGLHIMQTHMKLYPEQDLFKYKDRVKMFDKVVGTSEIRESLNAGFSIRQIEDNWQKELNDFLTQRKKYLLYK
jgi:uncharacterized protein YbbC (DUF1343 family)